MALVKKKQASEGKSRRSETQKKVSRGTAKMKEAADETLEANSKKIAESLLQKTLAGNTTSAKLLFELAERKIDAEDEPVMKPLRSLAEELAAEPEWTGEEIDSEE